MNCIVCGENFGLLRWKYDCPLCKRTVCSKCLFPAPDLFYLGYEKGVKWCQRCVTKINFDVKPKYKKALEIQDKVLTFTQNYKGKIHVKENSEQKEIITTFFKKIEDAYKSLRTMAAFQDCDIVFNVKMEKESKSSGNFIYSVFRICGIPALQKYIIKNN